MPPQVVNGPSLPVGLANCAICGAGTKRTGTTRRHRRSSYYSCAGHHAKGATACPGRHAPRGLDSLVLGALKDRLFAPERLRVLLQSLADQQALRSTEVARRLVALQAAADEAEAWLIRLYKAIEDGVADEDDILKERIAVLRAEPANAQVALTRAKLETSPAIVIDAERIARFRLLMRQRKDIGDVGAKRAYTASMVSSIEVHETGCGSSARRP